MFSKNILKGDLGYFFAVYFQVSLILLQRTSLHLGKAQIKKEFLTEMIKTI